ncbi:hypothetical protein PF007_g1672 [Phytophthora fragariae]|uniref:REJ domain-containing protein n=1 Tax=Phytophthora fragariae TaxID=53985 RepID=A0A6A3TJS4_9STRA|nr:hypothetical protein PF007_g1672 [Phytophthora fragariae]
MYSLKCKLLVVFVASFPAPLLTHVHYPPPAAISSACSLLPLPVGSSTRSLLAVAEGGSISLLSGVACSPSSSSSSETSSSALLSTAGAMFPPSSSSLDSSSASSYPSPLCTRRYRFRLPSVPASRF